MKIEILNNIKAGIDEEGPRLKAIAVIMMDEKAQFKLSVNATAMELTFMNKNFDDFITKLLNSPVNQMMPQQNPPQSPHLKAVPPSEV